MRIDAEDRRSTWLRRTRLITVWTAGAAGAATLLIGAVVGRAAPTRSATPTLTAPQTRTAQQNAGQHVGARHRHRHRAGTATGRSTVGAVRSAATPKAQAAPRDRVPHPVATKHASPTPRAPRAQAPTPAPAATPVVVSGGS